MHAAPPLALAAPQLTLAATQPTLATPQYSPPSINVKERNTAYNIARTRITKKNIKINGTNRTYTYWFA